MEITSDDGQHRWAKSYGKGIATSECTKSTSDGAKGTSFKLRLSTDVVGQPDLVALSETLETQAYLYPNIRIALNEKTFIAPDGLLSLALQISTEEPHDAPCFYYNDTFEDIHIQAAILGRAQGDGVQRSWVNGQESRYGGSHAKGLESALDSFGWRPKVCLLNVTMQDPKFAGPTKDILLSTAVCGKVQTAMRGAISAANLALR